MSRRKAAAQPVPTPEQVKALADRMDWAGQHTLLQLFLLDKQSGIGKAILAMLSIQQAGKEYLERRAGLTPEDIDPHKLLSTEETDKMAKKRTGKKSVNAVRQERHRAKKRLQQSLLPPFSAPS
jgi:hypothetical protein